MLAVELLLIFLSETYVRHVHVELKLFMYSMYIQVDCMTNLSAELIYGKSIWESFLDNVVETMRNSPTLDAIPMLFFMHVQAKTLQIYIKRYLCFTAYKVLPPPVLLHCTNSWHSWASATGFWIWLWRLSIMFEGASLIHVLNKYNVNCDNNLSTTVLSVSVYRLSSHTAPRQSHVRLWVMYT